MKMKFLVFFLAFFISSCAWVKLTPEGKKVVVLDASEVTNCKLLGKSTVSVKADVASIERNKEKVKEELETLARNNAVNLKGDTVVAVTEIHKGQQVFNVYRCRV